MSSQSSPTSEKYQSELNGALRSLRESGVIAYPTEFCFGLGCDPQNTQAIERILEIKRRKKDQGLILIGASVEQLSFYADLKSLDTLDSIEASWPGPNTWILPAKNTVSNWVRGEHQGIAMRIPGHQFCRDLCLEFGQAIVSTSANRHGQEALLSYESVLAEMGDEVDHLVDLDVGGAQQASTIRDALTGEVLR